MRWCITKWLAALGLTMMAASSGSADFNHVLNGSFEEPKAIGDLLFFNPGVSTLTDWNVFGPSGSNVAIIKQTFQANGATFNAEDGSQSLDLTGNTKTTAGVSQDAATTVGDTYQLSYFVGNTTAFGTTSTVDVSLNGVLTYTDTNSNVSPTNVNWEPFAHTFVATSTTTTLAFANGDPSNDGSNLLDNVVLVDLTPPSTAVPEPPSLVLASLGLLGCLTGYAWRRRKTPAIA